MKENKIFVIASFLVTDPLGLENLKEQWRKRDAEHKRYTGRSLEQTRQTNESDMGGAICLLDPFQLNRGFISEYKVPCATGLFYDKNLKALYCGSAKTVKVIQHGRVLKTYSNRIFNDIHGISQASNGNLLVVSTGTDSILEFQENNFEKPVWDWIATENGFNLTPDGRIRFIDRNSDYTKKTTSTPEHTTHINSCLDIGSNKILAMLFHQGLLVEIDKKTKKYSILLKDLKCPHSIRFSSFGYILSDTLNNRVLLLSKKFEILNILKNNFNLVQDALEIGKNEFLVADSNNSRIIRINSKSQILDILDYSKNDRKIFCMQVLTKNDAGSIFINN